MGDRGNIAIQEAENDRIYLYTHWRGSELPEVVQAALRKRQRWDDTAYLTRIVFNQLQDGDRNETGYGISTSIQDNERLIVLIDTKTQTVSYTEEDGRVVRSWSFVGFVKADIKELTDVFLSRKEET